jgi:hypothetical protein
VTARAHGKKARGLFKLLFSGGRGRRALAGAPSHESRADQSEARPWPGTVTVTESKAPGTVTQASTLASSPGARPAVPLPPVSDSSLAAEAAASAPGPAAGGPHSNGVTVPNGFSVKSESFKFPALATWLSARRPCRVPPSPSQSRVQDSASVRGIELGSLRPGDDFSRLRSVVLEGGGGAGREDGAFEY